MFSHFLLDSCSFCIYGAGIVASSVYTAMQTLYHKEPLFFLVSDIAENSSSSEQIPAEIDGIKVKSLSMWEHELQAGVSDTDIPACYLIATPETHHQAITDLLRSMEAVQIENAQIIPLTNELENELMETYYCSLFEHETILSILAKGQSRNMDDQEISSIQVFQAKSHMDKPLRGQQSLSGNRSSILPRYITPIQVGATLTTQSIENLKDNTGDNISIKNRNYCELTATYYAWKHSQAAYKGICHYRRIFDISDEQMKRLLEPGQEWDVILPYPSVYYPDISKEHTRYVNESDWNAMLQALSETAPEYLEAYEKGITDGEKLFNNFNMLIAKAEVFDDYCKFLFTVLERTEEHTTPKGSERADRFAGYLGENLTTIYFLKNRDKWKIAYAGKMWLT